MHFTKAHIQGFRGISDLDIDDFRRINLLVGKNNSGKTSILEALFLLVGVSNPQLTVNINRFRDILDEPDEKNFRLLFKDLNFDTLIVLKAYLDEKNQERTLHIRPHYQKQSIVDKNQLKVDLSDAGNSLTSSSFATIDGLVLDFEIKEKHSKRENYSAEIISLSRTTEVLQPHDYKEKINAVFVNLRTIYQNIDQKVDKLIIEKQDENLVSVLQKVDSKITGISLGANGIVYCDIGLDKLVPINIMGDGIRRILSIVTTIASIKNGIVFIDEIENGFHYSVLKVLWGTILEASRQYNVQVFATTHSEECIAALNSSYISNIDLFERDSIRLYRVEKDRDEHRAVSYDPEVLSTSLELELGVR
ncbi:AAA family ATPase [Tunicatimonas pelagia]|uniref:AAA family ATPase n=1 Tax=Tunicatimonas pelagia TaxID=931531 RepID=UPI0026671D92|nr:AAA family ATPase [Tunicatimonas pelagia]WKN46071.1 AAA family ATPase [Tunicatimonas pelagia]